MIGCLRLPTYFLVAISLGPSMSSRQNDNQASQHADTTQLQRAADGVARLQRWYNSPTGLYQSTGWWNSANGITVLVDFARLRKSTSYNSILENTLTAAQTGKDGSSGFLNKYYDDEGWWALAWIDAYDLTGDHRYLAVAESIFADITTGWDNSCGGGIWWSKDRQYKAAIANELFLSVGAHLANRVRARRPLYLDWANKEWRWFAHSGMINAQNLINDGLGGRDSKTPENSCANNGLTTWTYNQGVVLGGLVELSKLNADPSIPQTAHKIATAAITSLVDENGILHDTCEPDCGADGVQFKGIFVRNLAVLDHAFPQPTYTAFIQRNANSIWNNARGPDCMFGQVWSGPFAPGNAASQIAALDDIVAAASFE